MLQLRPFVHEDAQTIVRWIKDEHALRQWSADRYGSFPITAADICAQYADADPACFFPLTAADETGVVGHLILRYTDAEKTVVRFGFVIVDDRLRGKGYGKAMLRLALHYAFEQLHARRVTLGVFDNNPAAHYCYLAAGFRDLTSGEPHYFHIGQEDWLCLELAVTLDEYRAQHA